MPLCPKCGTDNPAGFKFCGACGSPFGRRCPNCGSEVPEGFRFCGTCGTDVQAGTPVAPPAAVEPVSERRLVSVLFADLVGFTSLSEKRDAEEVRELLSRYFDTCRKLVGLYGGTIEKFIGDAVMAVWGTPVAQEDDAERAVRTALDLVEAVAQLGAEVGAPELRARAGVLTGEAAVTVGAQSQGMVAGDLVNTASRIQSAAEPGQVFVGESTRRATEASVVYEDAGDHTLKGKTEPMHLWHATRIVAGIGGALKSEGLEAPFVGRDRELRLIKDLFHVTADEGKAHLVSVTGIAGIGKSRIMWEFFKYIDGVAARFRWHRGRCLSYGEGVTYWALAEMVRTRCDIVEAEEQTSAMAKLRKALEESVPDLEERKFIEPRLAHLLGLEERTARDREDLFSAWRLFYERLSEQMPTIMVFEDVQWADASLLDFIDYLLEWSRNHRIFILTLGRPEISAKRPEWGGGKRGMTTMYLDPLSHQSMLEMMNAFVPGLPEDARDRILARSEGIPLYAVETVRMLLDRGLLVREGPAYRLTGGIEELEIPETLHALIAARLDGLTTEERRLGQDGAVLGKTFTRESLAAVSGFAELDLDPLLASLVRKEVLTVQADIRSPERGQYGFVQDLVRQVAYDTLSKKDRKARHLAAARYLVDRWGEEEEEIIEVVASHYVEAYHAAPSAEDAGEIKTRAREMLARAAKRAASLAAGDEALRYYEQAAELADEGLDRADLLERAGSMAALVARNERAVELFKRSIEIFKESGLEHAAARAEAAIAEVYWNQGHLSEATALLRSAYDLLSTEEPDEALATVAAQLGRFLALGGQMDEAAAPLEQALEIAEVFGITNVFSNALTSKSLLLMQKGRYQETELLLRHSLDIALRNELGGSTAQRAYANLAVLLEVQDRYEELLALADEGLERARRVGDRANEMAALTGLNTALMLLGRWDEAIERNEQGRPRPDEDASDFATMGRGEIAYIHLARGELVEATAAVEPHFHLQDAEDPQRRLVINAVLSSIAAYEGRYEDALRHGERAVEESKKMGMHAAAKEGIRGALEAAADSKNTTKLEEYLQWIEQLRPRELSPYLRHLGARFGSRLAALRGDKDSPDSGFASAEAIARDANLVFPLAVALTEHAEWLIDLGRNEEASLLLDEAAAIFEPLRARPYLERIEAARARAGVTVRT
jgi:predicted ATPase/class 3 adenylate cyclase